MPLRIFSLEFIRQSIATNQLHFLLAKKGHLFKLGILVGTFVVNSRQVFGVVEAFLREVNFDIGEAWHYDPHGVIA